MHSTSFLAVCLLGAAPAVHAWGTLGHQTVGFIAQNFISAQTVTWAQGILGNSSSSYVAGVATWADSYRYTAAGKFSAPFHYIDANDSPPSSCNVDFNRDCGLEGCVVSAIANYTQRVKDGRLTAAHKKEALEFLIHFIGDITQPLHDEATQTGGNGIDVTFDGAATNLHSIWDTRMPEKLRGGYALSDAQKWANELTTAIKTGQYKSAKAGWLTGTNIKDAKASAMVWAQDANKFVCDPVLKGGESAVENGDLGGAYYNAAVPVFTVQIAKAGYRLAAWMNLLATGSTQL